MKKIIITALVAGLFSITSSYAQIKNATTVDVKISGNCGMCESTIEKAATDKKLSIADWNKDSKMATITYNSKKTDLNTILKKIALAGYDSEQFLAPDAAYNNLPGCCKYDRTFKTAATMPAMKDNAATEMKMNSTEDGMAGMAQEKNQLGMVFDNYFMVKDALVKSDATLTATNAGKLLDAINEVKMEKLSMTVHTEWMKQLEGIKAATNKIKSESAIAGQRKSFIDLTSNVYALIKIAQPEGVVYYQHCPMANSGKGADWLSKDSNIKNPYYGSMMLTCGSTVETIK